jgi:hypothetical protein
MRDANGVIARQIRSGDCLGLLTDWSALSFLAGWPDEAFRREEQP